MVESKIISELIDNMKKISYTSSKTKDAFQELSDRVKDIQMKVLRNTAIDYIQTLEVVQPDLTDSTLIDWLDNHEQINS